MNIIVNFDKDTGISSQEAVIAVKKRFKSRKAGHAGTLDPLATGVLLVCLNEATKITGYLSSLDKEYITTLKLGEITDTYDSEGKLIQKVEDFEVSEAEIKEVLKQFIGDIEQIPPMYSAIKLDGKPLYKLARSGVNLPLKPRKVSIYSIDLLGYAPPFISLRASCSKGAYIRSLCNDIGAALGLGAHMTALKRTKVGEFTIENSAKIRELPLKTESLYSIDCGLRHLLEIRFSDGEVRKIKNGNAVSLNGLSSANLAESRLPVFVRLKDADGKLFGIGRLLGGRIKPERLFS